MFQRSSLEVWGSGNATYATHQLTAEWHEGRIIVYRRPGREGGSVCNGMWRNGSGEKREQSRSRRAIAWAKERKQSGSGRNCDGRLWQKPSRWLNSIGVFFFFVTWRLKVGNLGLVERLFKAIGDLISFYLSERMALVFTSFSPVFTRWWPLYLRDLHSVQEDRERQREKLHISGVCPLLESTQRCSI